MHPSSSSVMESSSQEQRLDCRLTPRSSEVQRMASRFTPLLASPFSSYFPRNIFRGKKIIFVFNTVNVL